jgi:Sortase domain
MRRGSADPGPAAGPDAWPAARPADATDPWGILPVSGTRYDGPDDREDEEPARRTGHRGRLRLVRSPLAWAVLVAGLAVVAGGAAGLSRLSGHPGQVARPLATASPAPRGVFAAPPLGHARGPVSRPIALAIPAIGVRTRLIKLGRTRQGTLQVPTSTSVAGWYTASPRPGAIGSSIIAGHIDSYLGPGVFFRLRLLRPGDLVYVRRANGTLAVFRVYAEHMYAKAHFPTQRVYGPEPDAELHLITCGGAFDSATGYYLSNVVVYSTEIRVHQPRRHARRRHHPRARHS